MLLIFLFLVSQPGAFASNNETLLSVTKNQTAYKPNLLVVVVDTWGSTKHGFSSNGSRIRPPSAGREDEVRMYNPVRSIRRLRRPKKKAAEMGRGDYGRWYA